MKKKIIVIFVLKLILYILNTWTTQYTLMIFWIKKSEIRNENIMLTSLNIILNDLAFKSLEYDRTWWRFFQKRVMCSTFKTLYRHH